LNLERATGAAQPWKIMNSRPAGIHSETLSENNKRNANKKGANGILYVLDWEI
jgi:hypothetical protein